MDRVEPWNRRTKTPWALEMQKKLSGDWREDDDGGLYRADTANVTKRDLKKAMETFFDDDRIKEIYWYHPTGSDAEPSYSLIKADGKVRLVGHNLGSPAYSKELGQLHGSEVLQDNVKKSDIGLIVEQTVSRYPAIQMGFKRSSTSFSVLASSDKLFER